MYVRVRGHWPVIRSCSERTTSRPLREELRLLIDILRRADSAIAMEDLQSYVEAMNSVSSVLTPLLDLPPNTEPSLVKARDAITTAAHTAQSLQHVWNVEQGNAKRAEYLESELAKPHRDRSPAASEQNRDLARRRQGEGARERARLVSEFRRQLERCKALSTAAGDSAEPKKP
jgi:hypothetical protein